MAEVGEVPEEIDEIFKEVKQLDSIPEMEDERWDELFAWIDENVPSRGLKPFVTQSYDYNDTQYSRLLRARKKRGYRKTKEVDTRKQLEKNEKKDLTDFIDGQWEDIKRIGSKAVMDWASMAKDMGYYDEESEMLDMEAFIQDSVNFYSRQRPVVDELEARAKNNAAVARASLHALRKALNTLYSVRAYVETMRSVNPQVGMILSGLESMLPGGEKRGEPTAGTEPGRSIEGTAR